MIVLIVTILVALSISALCSLLEACSLSLSLTDIASISEKQPVIARIWKTFKENLEKPIAVILIVNTLAHTIGASLAGAQFNNLFGPKWIAGFSVVFSFAMIQWTEILPKTLGVKYNKWIASLAAVPLLFFVRAFTPIVLFFNFLNRPFISPKQRTIELDTLHDIAVLARFAALNNLLSKDQEEILSRTLHLSTIQINDVMVENEEVKYLSTTMSLTEALIYAHIHHHTRFPLTEGEYLDNIIGYVNFKDIVSVLQINPANPSLKGICRPILVIYEDASFPDLLNKLTRGYQHIAVVKDRQEHVLGIVTLEDVIEAIIGEVRDEYDLLPCHFYQITSSRYVAGGGIRLSELEEQLHLNLPAESTTLSEWLKEQYGRVPKIEEYILYEGSHFIVRKISRSNIYEVIIEARQITEHT